MYQGWSWIYQDRNEQGMSHSFSPNTSCVRKSIQTEDVFTKKKTKKTKTKKKKQKQKQKNNEQEMRLIFSKYKWCSKKYRDWSYIYQDRIEEGMKR